MEKYTSLYLINVYVPELYVGVYHRPTYNDTEWESYITGRCTELGDIVDLKRHDTLSNHLLEMQKYAYDDYFYTIKVTLLDPVSNEIITTTVLEDALHDDNWEASIIDVIHDQWIKDYGSRMVKSARK